MTSFTHSFTAKLFTAKLFRISNGCPNHKLITHTKLIPEDEEVECCPCDLIRFFPSSALTFSTLASHRCFLPGPLRLFKVLFGPLLSQLA